jgi:hypothetical protein
MKVYTVTDYDEGIAYCFDSPNDALETVEVWSQADLTNGDPDYQEIIREDVAGIKKVLAKNKGGYAGECYSLVIEIRSRKWFDSLPEDEEEEEVPHG